MPRERSGRNLPTCIPEQLSVGFRSFRRRNPKHRVSAIGRDSLPNGRYGPRWVFASLHRANSLPQQLPNESHTSICGSQVFQFVDGDGDAIGDELYVGRCVQLD